MTGHVVYRPSGEHECNPGVTYRPWPEDSEIPPPFEGARLVDNPEVRDYPRGTVWECECGTTWVSRGAAPTPPGWHLAEGSRDVLWKRESRRARRKRERQGVTPEMAFEGQRRLFERHQRIERGRAAAEARLRGGHASGKPHGPLPVVSDRPGVGGGQ